MIGETGWKGFLDIYLNQKGKGLEIENTKRTR